MPGGTQGGETDPEDPVTLSRAAGGSGAERAPANLDAHRAGVAVALDYPGTDGGAPRVAAKGRDDVAEEIVQLALAAGVRVRQDSDLAEVLAAVELDSRIPPEALVAVAEILRYAYRANGQTPPPDIARGDPGGPAE